MRIHHLNCTTMCPLGGLLMDGHSTGLHATLVCHCLLVETLRDGLVLVDTGFGLKDIEQPGERLSKLFVSLLRPRLSPEHTALRQIEKLGFSAKDVRHIVLTHLDFDHAGGLDDFPDAQVHLLATEHEVARQQRTWLDRRRFRPQQWSTEPHWIPYAVGGERWFGFESVRALRHLPEDILLVPLPGHTAGHAGVAVDRGGTWLLHCGDAYFYHKEMHSPPFCTPGLQAYQLLMQQSARQRFQNQKRLRQLARERAGQVRLFCAHDPTEFEALRGERPELEAAAMPREDRPNARPLAHR
jgi:glyoxylase-like metal-dependent hydrolase (beta-lactamase superfamily II)